MTHDPSREIEEQLDALIAEVKAQGETIEKQDRLLRQLRDELQRVAERDTAQRDEIERLRGALDAVLASCGWRDEYHAMKYWDACKAAEGLLAARAALQGD